MSVHPNNVFQLQTGIYQYGQPGRV